MNLLLDTHVWLWWLQGDPNLSLKFVEAIESANNEVWLSSISLWEVNLKRSRGKLDVDVELVSESVHRGLELLSFTVEHARLVEDLPDLHRDPFDRALIAQSIAEQFYFVTADREIRAYPGVRLLASE